MLALRARVRTRAEHDLVTRRGIRRARGPVVVHLLARPESAEAPRAGFIVGRRVGKAVTRNRVRRRLQHLVADRLEALPTGSLLLVRALPSSAAASFTELRVALDHVLATSVAPVTGTAGTATHPPGGAGPSRAAGRRPE